MKYPLDVSFVSITCLSGRIYHLSIWTYLSPGTLGFWDPKTYYVMKREAE